MEEMKAKIIEALTIKLQRTDADFDSVLLAQIVEDVLNEIKEQRNYSEKYTQEMIDKDIQRFYSTAREMAEMDYSMIGGEHQTSHSENGISRTFIDRNTLLSRVIPLSRVVK